LANSLKIQSEFLATKSTASLQLWFSLISKQAHIIRDKKGRRVLDNKVLSRIFGPDREQLTG